MAQYASAKPRRHSRGISAGLTVGDAAAPGLKKSKKVKKSGKIKKSDKA